LSRLDPHALHVINGDIAAGIFRQAFAATGGIVVHREVLSCGPTPAFLDIESWKRQRREFWTQAVANDPEFRIEHSSSDLLANVPRLAAAGRVYAWAASGNTDQLMVVFLYELLEQAGADPGKLELVEFATLPPHGRRVMAMGELEESEMRRHPVPRALLVDEWMTYRHAWRAVSSADPTRAQNFAVENPRASEWLKAAVRLLLRRYPDRVTGLPHWDYQLLRNVRERGPRAGRIISFTLGENLADGDLTGDLYLFWRLLRMGSASLPRPLLTLMGDGRTFQGTSIELTEFGLAVLEGRECATSVNPVDDWAGGVHLSTADGNVWFNDGGRIVRG
jgi:hypothetical protein